MDLVNNAPETVPGLAVGSELTSDWVKIDQELIDLFSRATLDNDPMHVDPEFAAKGPYKGTVAFGFMTMSLMTHFMHTATDNEGTEDFDKGYFLNYGFDRMRLVSPVRVNSRVRGKFTLTSREPDEKGRFTQKYDCLVEIEGEDRPALAGTWLSVYVPPSTYSTL
ncbi:MaoC family dehydratase [Sphingomonas sp. TX0543]|uniref:MaoC family dehydratase n=1 Tax=unclassified Sphingomonas TaxID=196159 RepID=UPI0010F8CAA1|nr:MaoC family dehydratase [Sphingomonas sp. 3P27F8]